MEAILQTLLENGVAGIMLAFFIWYLSKRDKEHMEERDKFYNAGKDSQLMLIKVIENNNEALAEMRELIRDSECKFSNKH